jgi:hypothetical protein
MSVTLPRGKFQGYALNRLAGLEPDDDITRIGPGTPAGEYLRRFWMPIALTNMVGELALRLRRMGEDPMLYRNRAGELGLLVPQSAERCLPTGVVLRPLAEQVSGVDGMRWLITLVSQQAARLQNGDGLP